MSNPGKLIITQCIESLSFQIQTAGARTQNVGERR
jgi:hypothetical protein